MFVFGHRHYCVGWRARGVTRLLLVPGDGSQVAGVELDEPQEALGVVLLVWIARARSQRLMSRKDRGARSGRSGSQGQGPETQAAGSTGRVVYEYTCG